MRFLGAAPAAAAPAGKTKYPENYKAGNDRCPRCNDRVYFAEKMVANGINWHKVKKLIQNQNSYCFTFSNASSVPFAISAWTQQLSLSEKRKSTAKAAMERTSALKASAMALAPALLPRLSDARIDLSLPYFSVTARLILI